MEDPRSLRAGVVVIRKGGETRRMRVVSEQRYYNLRFNTVIVFEGKAKGLKVYSEVKKEAISVSVRKCWG